MISGVQFLENANRWKNRWDCGETQAAIAKSENCAASYISGAVRVLDLPERYHEMLRADAMQIEAAIKLTKVPSDLRVPSLDLAIQFRTIEDAINRYNAELTSEKQPSKARRSEEGKVRIQEASIVVDLLKSTGVKMNSW